MDPLSFTNRRWNLREEEGRNPRPPLLERLMALRAVSPVDDDRLCDPFIFPDMAAAKERIDRAAGQKETVGIFGDYDCDGITGAAILARAFQRRHLPVQVYLPHRLHEGYGVSGSGIDRLKERGVSLIVTVDTGITAIGQIAYAKSLGMDVIITDHHELKEELPSGCLILHPFLARGYPMPGPSGAGVAYHLVRALEEGSWEDREQDEALAMIGTVADLVPLGGENRTLVRRGLRALSSLRNCPLAVLRDRVRSGEAPLKSEDVAFRIAPRINAAGRMDSPSVALRALLQGGEALDRLDALNTRRQHLTEGLLAQIHGKLTDSPFLFLASPDFPPGILGLLAGKVTDLTGRPSAVACVEGDLCRASLRSPSCYHVTRGLTRAQDLLLSFGGHAQAAGCTFQTNRMAALEERLIADVLTEVPPSLLVPSLEIDTEIDPLDISSSLLDVLARLEPFGQGNPKPRFLLRNISLRSARCVGQDGAHLQASLDGHACVGFHMGKHLSRLGEPVDIACSIGVNEWRGTTGMQICIEDMREARMAAVQ